MSHPEAIYGVEHVHPIIKVWQNDVYNRPGGQLMRFSRKGKAPDHLYRRMDCDLFGGV
jgi:hypothetical protein